MVDAVVDDELVVGQQVQHGVLEDLHVVADPHGAVGVADDLDAGADDRAFADHDVAGDLRGREQHGGVGDGRQDAAVVVELAHGETLQSRSDGVDRMGWKREVTGPQTAQPLEVGIVTRCG